MTAAEARVLMQGEKYKGVDASKQLTAIYAKIEEAATKGSGMCDFDLLHPTNKEILIGEGYSISTNAKTDANLISWV